jgi:hypothetical protein
MHAGLPLARSLRFSEHMNSVAGFAWSEDAIESLASVESLLPAQLAQRDTRHREKLLMAAVLEEAVSTLNRDLHATTRSGQRLFREADEWIRSPETSWPFAFENICQTLALDPEYLRAGLERLKERRVPHPARVYRLRRVSGSRTFVLKPPRDPRNG